MKIKTKKRLNLLQLIDDLKVLREKNEKLEEENEKLKKDNLELDDTLSVMSEDYSELSDENRQLKKENKALRLQANTYFDEWQEAKKNYITLTYHIRLKASVNPGEHRYI